MPALDCNERPNTFHYSERPCSLKKPIGRTKNARDGEPQNVPVAAFFERIRDQHGRNRKQSEERQMAQGIMLAITPIRIAKWRACGRSEWALSLTTASL